MADEQDAKGKTEETQDQPEQTQSNGTLSREDVEKMIQSATDRVRTEYVGKLKDVEKERDELRQKNETTEERLERQLRELDQAKQNMERAQLAVTKRDVMSELGIPKKFEGRIYGDTPESIRKDAEEFARIYADDLKEGVQRGVNEKLASSGAAPKNGEQPKQTRKLETREDGANATDADVAAYFEEIFKE